MNEWRLIDLETHDAFMNMSIDEAVLMNRVGGLAPNTIRLYRWLPSAVSLGKFQDIKKETHLNSCRKRGISVVRRITGGGSVYHDAEGEITYSIVTRREDIGARDATAVYAKIYSGLAEALRLLHLKADFSHGNLRTCPNMGIKGRKISGSAQSHKGGIVLQHGTLLLNANLDRMFSFLRVPWAKSVGEAVGIARTKITSIYDETGKPPVIGEVSQALVRGFGAALGIDLRKGCLSTNETELAERLNKRKYSTQEWNLHGSFSI